MSTVLYKVLTSIIINIINIHTTHGAINNNIVEVHDAGTIQQVSKKNTWDCVKSCPQHVAIQMLHDKRQTNKEEQRGNALQDEKGT